MTNMTNVYTNHSKIFRKDNFCDEIPEVLLYIAIIVIVCVFTMDIMFVYQKHTLDLQCQKDDMELGSAKRIEKIEKEMFYQQITHQEMITNIYEKIQKEMIEQQIINQKTMTKIYSRIDHLVRGTKSFNN